MKITASLPILTLAMPRAALVKIGPYAAHLAFCAQIQPAGILCGSSEIGPYAAQI